MGGGGGGMVFFMVFFFQMKVIIILSQNICWPVRGIDELPGSLQLRDTSSIEILIILR